MGIERRADDATITPQSFVAWAAQSRPGDHCTYHCGSLGQDRLSDPVTAHVADTALLLADTGFLGLIQRRRYETTQYIALRTGGGYMPRAIHRGNITPLEWRLLAAIQEARHGRSITRVVRDVIASSSDAKAKATVQALLDREWIEKEPPASFKPNGGYRLTEHAIGLLL